MATQTPQQPRPYGAPPHPHQPFLPNGSMSGPMPQPAGVAGLPPNKVLEKSGVRVLCIADVRGHLRTLNELAKKANADYILHTGDFGFYDESSLDRIADKTLKHVAQYSPLLPDSIKLAMQRHNQPNIKNLVRGEQNPLSELPLFLSGKYTLDVPVYTVWGACEDVRVLEKFRSGEYKVNNLHIIDEASSRLLDVGGVKLRLLGLGGAVVMHKLFDNGEGRTTIAGGQGTMWTTLLQMGELVDTANRVYDPTETRIFITHNSPAREGLLNQLSVTLKADFSISAGLHFRYGSSYNEFSVNPSLDHYRGKLASSKASFNDVWETVKGEVEPCVSANAAQQQLIKNALDFVGKMPTSANGGNPFGGPTANAAPGAGQIDESAFKNMWNFNLADAAFGWLVLEVENGRIGTEMKAQGFNFSHRGGKPAQGGHQPAQPAQQPQQQQQQQQAPVPTPANAPMGPSAQTSTPTTISPALPLTNVPSGPLKNRPLPSQQQAPTSSTPIEKENSPNLRNIEPALPYTSKPSTPRPAVATPEPPVAAAEPTEEPKAEEPTNDASSPRESRPPREKQHGLYMINISTRDAARELIPEEFHSAIKSIDEKSSQKSRKVFYLVHMESDEVAQKALEAISGEYKSGARGDGKPFVKLMDDHQPPQSGGWGNRGGGREGMGESRWSRGGNTSESDNPSGGYRGRGGRGGKFRGGERRDSGAFDGPSGRGGRGGTQRGGRRGGGTSQGQE